MKCVNNGRHYWKHGYQCEKCGVHHEDYLNDVRKPNNRRFRYNIAKRKIE